MKFSSSLIFLRPVCFIILLGLSSFIVAKLCVMTKEIEHNEYLRSIQLHNKSLSEIDSIARLLLPSSSSASNLARALSSSLNGTQLTFQAIQSQVAPALFLAFSTIPLVSEVSYIGINGLFFSFYDNDGETLSAFANTSFSSNFFTQPVNRDTGKIYGEAIGSNFTTVNASWLEKRINQTDSHSLLGLGWNKSQDLLFQNIVPINGRGLIRISFPAKVVIDQFRDLDFNGGNFHLASNDGKVLIQSKLPEININDYDLKRNHGTLNGKGYVFYCSVFEILGVKLVCSSYGYQSITKLGLHERIEDSLRPKMNDQKIIKFALGRVYTLAYPTNGMETVIHKNSKLAVTLLVVLFVILVVAIFIFIVLMIKSARREMFLCAALIKQIENTHQAEQKSMNKSLAFAKASHDIRGSLAAFSGLIEFCQEDPNPSRLATSLVQMNTCTEDLLGILNSVLDRCKIEAGKMQLEDNEFNISQLLEDVVDMFYPVGLKKGVDVVFDPCDGSIFKLCHVKGDRGKLKQILCNLVSNAVKFTSEGHISIRAMVNETASKENKIIASNHNGIFNCLSSFWCKKNGNLEGIHTVHQNPNSMEFVFEVDDTGNGIPKDKQKSVFENFVQVKETALGQEGSGLGLGIVQSLVRLMGGEINIIDKEHGEKGTCFRFNIFLATSDLNTDEQGNYIIDVPSSSGSHQHFGLQIRSPSLKAEGSHVILLIAGDERRKVAKKVIENLGIKVSLVQRPKHNSDFSQTSSGKKELTLSDHFNKCSSSHSSPDEEEDQDLSLQPHNEKSVSKSLHNFVLIVIDSKAAPFSELCSLVANLKRVNQRSRCKVVWLDNPADVEDSALPSFDHTLFEPFHGSHLYRVLGFLPEFGGTHNSNIPRSKTKDNREIQELEEIVVQESDERSREKPLLRGKKVLVVEDSPPLCMLATRQLSKFGAIVDVCGNGKEAFDRVCKVLRDQRDEGISGILPYHYIFMDCQMPIMNGYEATKLIRVEEKHYGVRIPIIALTAEAAEEEIRKTKEAGMDFHLTKPLKQENLLHAISALQNCS